MTEQDVTQPTFEWPTVEQRQSLTAPSRLEASESGPPPSIRDALKAAVSALRRDRSELLRKRREGQLAEWEQEFLSDLESEIHRLETKITPPPGLGVLERLEALAERVLSRESGLGPEGSD